MSKKEEKKTNVHEIEIKFEKDEWTKAQDEAWKNVQKKVNMDGFRKGKVPRNVYEKKYGKGEILIEAANSLVDPAYHRAMEESKLIPAVTPSVDIKEMDEEKVTFAFKIITKPEVKIKKYKGLNIKPEKIEVTKEEIDHQIGHILEEYTELVTKEGKVENGDIAIIDFEGFKDGVAFDGGKGENYSLEIGSNTFIPGFEEQVIGMKPEEEKEIKVVFPEDYGVETLKGAPAVFKVKLHEIKEKKAREFDEEFFEDLAMEGVDSKEKLEKEVEKEIKAQKEMDNENKYVDKLLEEIAKNVEVDIPQEMVDEESDRLLKNFEQQMAMQGISLDIYYKFTGSSEKDLREQLDKEAYNNVLYRLMLEEIMNLEKVEVSEKEAEKEAEELSKKYKMEKEEFLKQLGGIEMIQYDLEMRKVVELLKEANK
ncbi:MAG: trigger factor [Bacilli bacterium]|nr:trigger factor [Bacilli bacterium]